VYCNSVLYYFVEFLVAVPAVIVAIWCYDRFIFPYPSDEVEEQLKREVSSK